MPGTVLNAKDAKDTEMSEMQTSPNGGSSPQPLWHQGLVLWKTIFPWRGFRGVGGMVSG